MTHCCSPKHMIHLTQPVVACVQLLWFHGYSAQVGILLFVLQPQQSFHPSKLSLFLLNPYGKAFGCRLTYASGNSVIPLCQGIGHCVALDGR